jgi:glycosyltransferase involved in cell wall biosynthesis
MYLVFHKPVPVDSVRYTPWRMRSWVKTVQNQVNPDIVWMNYSVFDPLVTHDEKRVYILDYHDLVSLNQKMQKAVKSTSFSKLSGSAKNLEILNEDFLEKKHFLPDESELRIIARYDKVIAISQKEADLLLQFDKEMDVTYLPATCSPVYCQNTYNNSAIFVTGPNVFNFQGLVYFGEKVLPSILKEIPDFDLWITGTCSEGLSAQRGISLLGFVDNLSDAYCCARFAVCPVLGGTGQQIKIVEAMAHGLPVVATRYSAGSSPITHGVDGFVATDASEFAGYCVRLWQDPDLCREMGSAARETVRMNYGEKVLREILEKILEDL